MDCCFANTTSKRRASASSIFTMPHVTKARVILWALLLLRMFVCLLFLQEARDNAKRCWRNRRTKAAAKAGVVWLGVFTLRLKVFGCKPCCFDPEGGKVSGEGWGESSNDAQQLKPAGRKPCCFDPRGGKGLLAAKGRCRCILGLAGLVICIHFGCAARRVFLAFLLLRGS
eukprot:s815_g7.t1